VDDFEDIDGLSAEEKKTLKIKVYNYNECILKTQGMPIK